jgi:hypothetical protein
MNVCQGYGWYCSGEAYVAGMTSAHRVLVAKVEQLYWVVI